MKKFIEDAIAGGWRPLGEEEIVSWHDVQISCGSTYEFELHEYRDGGIKSGQTWKTRLVIEEVLLDPSAWRAVGKTRGWGICPSGDIWQGIPKWKYKMHTFLDHLIDGLSIEQALKEIR